MPHTQLQSLPEWRKKLTNMPDMLILSMLCYLRKPWSIASSLNAANQINIWHISFSKEVRGRCALSMEWSMIVHTVLHLTHVIFIYHRYIKHNKLYLILWLIRKTKNGFTFFCGSTEASRCNPIVYLRPLLACGKAFLTSVFEVSKTTHYKVWISFLIVAPQFKFKNAQNIWNKHD